MTNVTTRTPRLDELRAWLDGPRDRAAPTFSEPPTPDRVAWTRRGAAPRSRREELRFRCASVAATPSATSALGHPADPAAAPQTHTKGMTMTARCTVDGSTRRRRRRHVPPPRLARRPGTLQRPPPRRLAARAGQRHPDRPAAHRSSTRPGRPSGTRPRRTAHRRRCARRRPTHEHGAFISPGTNFVGSLRVHRDVVLDHVAVVEGTASVGAPPYQLVHGDVRTGGHAVNKATAGLVPLLDRARRAVEQRRHGDGLRIEREPEPRALNGHVQHLDGWQDDPPVSVWGDARSG